MRDPAAPNVKIGHARLVDGAVGRAVAVLFDEQRCCRNKKLLRWEELSMGSRKCTAGWKKCTASWSKCAAGWRKCTAGWKKCTASWKKCTASWSKCAAGWRKCTASWKKCTASWSKCAAGWRKCATGWRKCAAGWRKYATDWPLFGRMHYESEERLHLGQISLPTLQHAALVSQHVHQMTATVAEMASKHKDDRACGKCAEVFHKGSIADHEKLHHKWCEDCNLWIIGKQLETHDHDGRKRHTLCCGRSWQKKGSLLQHMSRPHVRCYGCGKDWLESAIERHRRNCIRIPINEASVGDASGSDQLGTNRNERVSVQTGSTRIVIEDVIDRYRKRAFGALGAEIRMLRSIEKDDTRETADLSEHLSVLERSSIGEAMTKEEYFRLIRDNTAGFVSTRMFVICSSKDAREILLYSPLKVILLILDELNDESQNRLGLDEYLQCLEARRQKLDVHIYRKPAKEGRCAVSLEPTKAIQLLRDSSNGPVNFLSLPVTKHNPVPSCIANLPDLDLLSADLGMKGKQPISMNHRPAHSARFQLLASGGAVSPAHVDPHGASLTTGTVECGEKVWTLWPGWDLKQVEAHAQEGKYASDPISLHLTAGDVVLFPWCFHAVLTSLATPEICLMTGTMHYDSREIDEILERVEMQYKYPIANEEFCSEIIPLMTRIVELWGKNTRPWQWPDRRRLEECRRRLRLVREMRGRETRPKKRRRQV